MSQFYEELLSKLFREIEVDLGATNLSVLVLEAMYDAVKELKKQDLHHFYTQLRELTEHVESTKPKYSIIIDSFYEMLRLAYREDHKHKDHYPLKKSKFLKQVRVLIHDRKDEKKKIVKQSEKIRLNNKTVLLFSHSPTVEQVLSNAKNNGAVFSVIVAEQDPDKTGEIIDFLHRKKIPFRVAPSYMLTHLQNEIDMIFMGALTLKSTMDFVMDTGANGIVSQFHLAKKPIYTFISTSKFSLWEAEKRSEYYKHVQQRRHHLRSIDFERIKFSHDRVDVDLITKIVTEQGIYTSKQIRNVFKTLLKERVALEERIELLG